MDEHEAAAVRARSQRLLESSAEALQRSYERDIPRPEDMWQLPEPQHQPQPEPPPQRPKPAPAQATMSAADSAAWNKWLDARITTRLESFAGLLGGEIGKDTRQERAKTEDRVRGVEDRITKSEEATVQLIVELERRVAALEQAQQRAQPARPRLIAGGSSDAA